MEKNNYLINERNERNINSLKNMRLELDNLIKEASEIRNNPDFWETRNFENKALKTLKDMKNKYFEQVNTL